MSKMQYLHVGPSVSRLGRILDSTSTEPIEEGLNEQIERYIDHVRKALDPTRYPRSLDGKVYDVEHRCLDHEFERLKDAFQNHLLDLWSEAARREKDAAPPTSEDVP
jgi:hypothetical protein